jgi:hypothetical protein
MGVVVLARERPWVAPRVYCADGGWGAGEGGSRGYPTVPRIASGAERMVVSLRGWARARRQGHGARCGRLHTMLIE